MSYEKTGKPLDMPLGLRAQERSRNHVLDWGPDYPMGMDIFWRKWVLIVKYRNCLP